MPLFIASLNSGSNGNCYYIGNHTDAILVDAGISCRETEKRMHKLQLSMDRVRAIFVSHEHSDHITGIPGLSKKYKLPVFITPQTHRSSGIPIEEPLLRSFQGSKAVTIGSLTILPFSKSHDAVDPHSFLVSTQHLHVGIFTDIGYPCDNVKQYFTQCHAAFLESNFCEQMLEKGNYPVYLKRRISGNQGHLSNTAALDLFIKHRGPQLTHLILSHLSKNNNSPQLVEQLFSQRAGHTQIVVASRYEETAVYAIDGPSVPATLRKKQLGRNAAPKPSSQLSLF